MPELRRISTDESVNGFIPPDGFFTLFFKEGKEERLVICAKKPDGTIETIGSGDGGVVFVPTISEDHILSWTNNGDLPNPDPVYVKGEITEEQIEAMIQEIKDYCIYMISENYW